MLKRRALSATLWSGADIILRQGLQFVVLIVLARLLSPSEFGTVALLALFTGLAAVFVDGGFSAALIQRNDVDHTDESTVFWFNLAAGAAAAICLWAAAPCIAGFYHVKVLLPLTEAMAANVFVGSLGAIHSTLLSKRLDFFSQMKVGCIAALISGATAILLARAGYGVWALAAQVLTMTAATTCLLWLFNPWRPAWVYRRASMRKLFGFGGYHLASSLLEMAYARLYTLFIGRYYGVRELGFYNNADSTKQLPGGFLSSVLTRVSLPMFSAAAHDAAMLQRGTQLAVRGMVLLNAPMMLGMAGAARPLVVTLFGTPWLPAVPILQVLCLAGLFWPLHVINLNVLMAQGHSRLMFRLEVAKKLLGVVLLVPGAIYGVMGIAWSQVVFNLIAFVINAYYTGRLLGYGARAQFRDILPVFCVAALVGGGVYGVSIRWRYDTPLMLLGLILIGAAAFFAVASIARLDALHDIRSLPWRRGSGALDQ
jgi:O-antigen/teichoic acid export membrane protein